MIWITTIKNKIGRATHILRDEETYIVATAEMGSVHGLPKYTTRLANEMQQVHHIVGK